VDADSGLVNDAPFWLLKQSHDFSSFRVYYIIYFLFFGIGRSFIRKFSHYIRNFPQHIRNFWPDIRISPHNLLKNEEFFSFQMIYL
jgi:hypothetical protein